MGKTSPPTRAGSLSRVTRANKIYFPTKPGKQFSETDNPKTGRMWESCNRIRASQPIRAHDFTGSNLCHIIITIIANSIKKCEYLIYQLYIFLETKWDKESGKVFLTFSAFPLHYYFFYFFLFIINFKATIHYYAKLQIVGLEIC